MPTTKTRTTGTTLLELMTTLAVVAIVTTAAAPTFSDLYANNQRTGAVNGLFHALYLARSESLRRGRVVSICKSADGQTCTATNWNQGWMVFANTDRDEPPQRDPGEDVLKVDQGWTTGQILSNRHSYSFRPEAQAVVNGTLVFCDHRGSSHARAIIISRTGRARIAQRDGSNNALSCEEQ